MTRKTKNRKPKTIKVEFYGMDGEGRNKTEAKADAGRKIEAALGGSYAPTIVRYYGHSAIVYRKPTGWHYRLLYGGSGVKPIYGTWIGEKHQAIREAQHHIGQAAWDGKNDEALIGFVHPDDRIELRGWFAFQHRYQEYRKQGHDEATAHAMACGVAPEE